MATLTFSGIPSGIVQTSMDNVTYTEATSPITLVDGMYIWVSSSWQLIGQPVTYVNSVYVNENQNDVWSNSRESPFILTHGGTLNYTTSSTQTATSAFIAKYVEQPKTTLDLSTLSDIADGAHTVKVKAKADGYIDSEFSNEVSYTKAAASYTITFGTVTGEHTFKYHGSDYNIKFDDGSYLYLSSSSDISVEYYDTNGNIIGEIAVGGDNMATKFGVGGVNSSTVEYYGRLFDSFDSVDFGYFTVGDSEHLSPTVSSSNPHTTKTVSGELNIYGKYPD